jgi:subtilase family serine protease
MFRGPRKSRSVVVLATLAILVVAVPMLSQAANGRPSPNAQILGPEDQSKQITVTFWLKQHDKAGFDKTVRQMYDRNSRNYHHWLTLQDYQARFAPSGADMATIKAYLAANNLRVTFTDKLNHAVSARGTVADVQRATGVQLNRVLINGKQHRLPSAQPVLSGEAGKLVSAVQGLTDFKYQSHVARPVDADLTQAQARALTKVGKGQRYYNSNCLRDPLTKTFVTRGSSDSAVYSGSHYGGNIHALAPDLPPCGYDAFQIEHAYGLAPLYKKNLDGTGQTVVIVDAFGSDTLQSDIDFFSQINDLPALTPGANFNVYFPSGPTNCSQNTCGWDTETSLDVEWSHAIAPGANIALVVAVDNNTTNLDIAVLYAIDNLLGPVISNSYGIPEDELIVYDPAELAVEDTLNELAAGLGMSVNFSSGDNGDFLASYGAITVSMPASSPWATGVGGTSLFINWDHSIRTEEGWGTNLTRLSSYNPYPPYIPPQFLGFQFGAGGGTSAYFAKPSYQGALPGSMRLVPDISYDADPYTGTEVVDSVNISGTLQQQVLVVGGTSLACPMFSGMWAIATQAAGGWLGQAAPILYGLPAGAITDITAQNGPDNISGTTYNPDATYYSPADLVAPVQNTTDFMSAFYRGITGRYYAISFGTDSSLTVGPGWDNVTGLGEPNGANFVTAVAGAK